MYKLPLSIDLYTIETLKALSDANNKIGQLKGTLKQLPNPQILLNAITLGEAKDSSEIENIITTYDDLYIEMTSKTSVSSSAKEVLQYRRAITTGWQEVFDKGFISVNIIKKIQSVFENGKGGIRKLPGTVIKNMNTKEIVFTPPQSAVEILDYLQNLEQYINNTNMYDPLIDMALIHYQFESIHPFYDGNGRTGRILNVLYLVMKRKIDYPVLYLSKYIIQNKVEYYNLLKKCNSDIDAVHEFIRYMLKGIEETANFTIQFIEEILHCLKLTTEDMKQKLPKLYSKELVEFIYSDFYTNIDLYKNEYDVTRQTASNHLKQIEKNGFLISERIGKELIYKNVALISLMDKW